MPSSNSANPPLSGYGLTLQEPGLYDVLRGFKRNLLLNLHCVKIGTIQSYNAATRTASIQILFRRVLKNGQASTYPQLINCPVMTLQGGGFSLQLPVAAGDTCLVLFSDRNIDNWYQNGGLQTPADGRLHDISDGIAFVGLNWQNDATIASTSGSEARLIASDGTTKVGISGGKITIQNASENLGTILSNLATALSTLNGAIAAMTSASISAGTTQAIAAAQATTITALITALGELLY